MDHRRKEHLRFARYDLTTKLSNSSDIFNLCNFLVSKNQLTDPAMEEITHEKIPNKMMTSLLRTLSGGGDETYDVFRSGLIEINAPQFLVDQLPDFSTVLQTRSDSFGPSFSDNSVIPIQPRPSFPVDQLVQWMDPEPFGDAQDGMTSSSRDHSSGMTSSSRDPSTDERPGIALVINNINFEHLPSREEFSRDYMHLKKLLSDRKFEFFEEYKTSDLNANRMIEVMERYSQIKKSQYYSRGVVIILSHGWDLSFAAVDSTESTLLSIDRFCSKLEEDQTLDGAHFKQEIFLLQQNLQNNQSELVRVTSEENPFSQAEDSDFLVADSVEPGFDDVDGPVSNPTPSINATPAPAATSFSVRNWNFCHDCKIELSSPKVAKDHYKGKKHAKQVMKSGSNNSTPNATQGASSTDPNERIDRPAIVKSCDDIAELGDDDALIEENKKNKVVDTVPRFYQHDLYRRIMGDDSAYFCFLPTGMGKTLIACLVLSKMLELNPERCLSYFVTDKSLLATQQRKYMKRQFSDGATKHLKVGAICGSEIFLEEGENDARKHNILVVTAEYLRNRLNNGYLKWQDACCVIFDEVHHCDLNHPYRKLIQEFHLPAIQSNSYPKLIGLTASPAMKDNSKKSAFEELKERLRQFGEAKLVTSSHEVMQQYRVIPEISFRPRSQLQSGLSFVPVVFSLIRTFAEENEDFVRSLPSKMQQSLREEKSDLKQVYELSQQCDEILEEELEENMVTGVEKLIKFLDVIFFARFVNLTEALNALDIRSSDWLAANSTGGLFNITNTRQKILSLLDKVPENPVESDTTETPYLILLDEVEATFPDKGAAAIQDIFLLVLVKTRCEALALTKVMQKEPRLKHLKVECVVGHGQNKSGRGVKGMTVKKQSRALDTLSSKHILVATSVAEEGIDIPGCEKVIMFEAPKDTTAFVQIKGRARKQQSTVILIGPPSEQAKLHNLIHSEKYMLEAVQHMDNQVI